MKLKSLSLILAAVLLAGCQTDNTPKPTKLVNFQPSLNVQTIYDVSPNRGAGNRYLSFAPAVHQDMIVTVAGNGGVDAVSKQTGKTLWSYDLRQPVSATPTVTGDRVYVGTLDGWLYAFNKSTGKLAWQSALPSECLAAPAANGSTVVVHTHDGSVTAFSADRGEQLWQTGSTAPKLSLEGDSAPAIVDDNVVLGYDNGQLASYRLADGKLNWERPVAIPSGGSEVSQMVDITGTPKVEDGIVYAASYHGNLVAVNAADGSLIWQQPLSSYRAVAIAPKSIIVTNDKGGVQSFDKDTGQIQWTQKAFEWRSTSAPAVVGNFVVVGDFAGYVHWLSLDSGKQIAQSRFGSKPISSQPVTDAGVVYLTTSHGDLVALKPQA